MMHSRNSCTYTKPISIAEIWLKKRERVKGVLQIFAVAEAKANGDYYNNCSFVWNTFD